MRYHEVSHMIFDVSDDISMAYSWFLFDNGEK